jgi:5-(carboxyamino)imidazole ribonucleotide mutase
VATFAIGKAGAVNAALFAASILALQDPAMRGRLLAYRQAQTDKVVAEEPLA